MAATVTAEEVNAAFPNTLPDSVIDGFIATVDAADACLDANVTDADAQHTLKLYGVGHLVQTASGSALVSSERAATGASVSYRDGKSTSAWSMLQVMDTAGCITGLLSAGPRLFFETVDGI